MVLLKKVSWSFTRRSFFNIWSFMILFIVSLDKMLFIKKNRLKFYQKKFFLKLDHLYFFIVSLDTRLNENLLLFLNFLFIAFILWWKATFLTMKLTLSFPDDIDVYPGQLKSFNELRMIRNVYWKLKRYPFVLITIYFFQAIL